MLKVTGILEKFSLVETISVALIGDNLKRRSIQKALGESNEKLKTTYLELEENEDQLRNQYEIIKSG